MAKVSMEANGRFGQYLAQYVQKKGISLRDLAAKLDMTYEQMRKLWLGTSAPSTLALKEISRVLDMPYNEALKLVTADKMERKLGSKAMYNVLGRDPRLADVESLLPQLSSAEWDMFMSQMRGFVHEKRKKS